MSVYHYKNHKCNNNLKIEFYNLILFYFFEINDKSLKYPSDKGVDHRNKTKINFHSEPLNNCLYFNNNCV